MLRSRSNTRPFGPFVTFHGLPHDCGSDLQSDHVPIDWSRKYTTEDVRMPRFRHFNIQVENRFPTAIQPDVRLIRHGVCHILGIILVPNRVPKRVSANRVGAKRLFQIMRCWITSRHSPGRSSWASSKSKKSTVPEHTSGPLGAILLHQKRQTPDYDGGTKKGGKGHSQKR